MSSQLSAMLRVHEAENGLPDGQTKIIPMITETAAGVLSAATYRRSEPAACRRDLGRGRPVGGDRRVRTRDENGRYTDVFRLARTMTILGAAIAEVAAIDTVFVNFRDTDGLQAECMEAERDGFTGKMAIHPAQVPVINEAFTPSPKRCTTRRRSSQAFADAGNPASSASTARCTTGRICGGPSACWPGRRGGNRLTRARQSASQRGRRIEKTSSRWNSPCSRDERHCRPW